MYKSQTPWSLSPASLAERDQKVSRPAPSKRSLGFLKPFFIIAVVLSAIGLGVYLAITIYQQPIFVISQVNVEGAQHLSPTEIVSQAGLAGQNLLALSVDATEHALLENPWVRSDRKSVV